MFKRYHAEQGGEASKMAPLKALSVWIGFPGGGLEFGGYSVSCLAFFRRRPQMEICAKMRNIYDMETDPRMMAPIIQIMVL